MLKTYYPTNLCRAWLRKACKPLLFFLLIFLTSFRLMASDIVEIIPVTDQIIMIKFSDGYIKYNKKGEAADKTKAYKYPLDLNFASLAGSYAITSTDDANYSTLVSLLKVGRKSKPNGISNLCNWNGAGCINDYTSDHWIYLQLPTAMQRGKNYTVSFKYLADNMNSYTFKFDEYSLRSEAIHTNQVGYDIAAGLKYGYVGHWMGDMGPLNLDKYAGKNFYLVDLTTKAVKFTGQLTLRKKLETGGPDYGRPDNENGPYNNAFGADLYECNFSLYNTPGEYLLVVEGIGCSYPFEIKGDVYREAFYHSARALYHNRAGIALTAPYTKWTRPRNFSPADGFNPVYTRWRSMDSSEPPEDSITKYLEPNRHIPMYGWISDAGDWDPYPRHVMVPVMLSFAYELAPDNFKDGELNIPESGNGIPDILDAAGWQIYFMKRSMKLSPTGGVISRLEFYGNLPEGVPSWETPQTPRAFAEEPQSSLYFAAGAAQLAYNLNIAASKSGNPSIADSSASLISDARKAYTWALNNMRPGDMDKIKYDILFAAAWLYKYTGEDQYNNKFQELNDVTASSKAVDVLGGSNDNTRGLAVYTYATCPDYANLNTNLRSNFRSYAVAWADDRIISSADKKGARNGYEWTMPSIVGSTTTPATAEAMFAYKFTGNQKYRDYIYLAADYFLGGNAANMTWLTGVGDRNPEQVLHIDTWYNVHGLEEPYPGIIPYGPAWSQVWGGADGPWQPNYVRNRLYPSDSQFPVEDTWANNRFTPITDEFTIDQEVRGFMTYAFLTSAGGNSFTENKYPQAKITSPASGSVYNERDAITFTAIASDADGKVIKVEYFNKGRKLGESVTSPFTFTLQRAYADTAMEVYAVAVDNKGARTLSIDWQKINIRVNAKYKAPSIQLVKPDSASNQPAGSNIVIQTAVSVADGSVVKVEFLNNGQKIGESNSAPFSFTINNAKAGIYKISALAYDNDDNRASSKVLTFSVNGPKAPFYGSPVNIPGIIETEDYDKGGPGVGYKSANTTANAAYREDYVNVIKSFDITTTAFDIVNISDGDWMDYQVNITQAANYDLEVRYAAGFDGKSLNVMIDGNVVKTVGIPNVGWWPFQKTTVNNVPLPQGIHTMRIALTTGGINLNYVRFTLPGVAMDTTKPQQTYNLASSSASSTTATLHWHPYTDNVVVTAYDIFQNDIIVKTVTDTVGTVTDLLSNTTYRFSVRARDASNNASGLGNEIQVKTLDALPPQTSGTGLAVTYYDNIDFTGKTLSRTDETINFNWGSGSPDATIGSDTFSARWTGQIQPKYSETYTFYTFSDDGIRVWINNQLVINSYIDQGGNTERSGTIALNANQKYDIKVEYYENGGGALATLSWSSSSQAKQIVPKESLYPVASPAPGTGLAVTYYDNIDFTGKTLSRTDETINFNWGNGSPDATIGSDTFSSRWTGQVQPKYAETYTFYSYSDDGIRVWVNNQLVIDSWFDQSGNTERSGTILLAANQKYSIKVEYYENGGGALATLSWSSASQTKQIVPKENLFPGTSLARTTNEVAKNVRKENQVKADGGQEVELYPNPTTNSVNINLYSQSEQNLTIQIVNNLGATAVVSHHHVMEGNNRLTLDFNLKGGLYYVIINKNNEKTVKKLIIN